MPTSSPQTTSAGRSATGTACPIFPTVTGAVGVGTRGVPVEGVILVGEHGQYATNSRRQKLYPRRRLFDEVVHAFRLLGRRVPVFTDKHLSYDWLFARWMYDLARHEGIPLMAGSSLPVAWRVSAAPVADRRRADAGLRTGLWRPRRLWVPRPRDVAVHGRTPRGGETGVASVRTLTGHGGLGGGRSRASGRATCSMRSSRRGGREPQGARVRPLPDDTLFLIRYADGLESAVAMLGSVGEMLRLRLPASRVAEPDATVFDLQNGTPFGHFGYLLRAIEQMIQTGAPPTPSSAPC